MKMVAEEVSGIKVIRVCIPAINLAERQELDDTFNSLLEDNKPILLDLGDVMMVDSAGFGLLVTWRTRTKPHNSTLAVCSLSNEVARTFRAMRLNLIIDAYANRTEAIQAMSASG